MGVDEARRHHAAARLDHLAAWCSAPAPPRRSRRRGSARRRRRSRRASAFIVTTTLGAADQDFSSWSSPSPLRRHSGDGATEGERTRARRPGQSRPTRAATPSRRVAQAEVSSPQTTIGSAVQHRHRLGVDLAVGGGQNRPPSMHRAALPVGHDAARRLDHRDRRLHVIGLQARPRPPDRSAPPRSAHRHSSPCP